MNKIRKVGSSLAMSSPAAFFALALLGGCAQPRTDVLVREGAVRRYVCEPAGREAGKLVYPAVLSAASYPGIKIAPKESPRLAPEGFDLSPDNVRRFQATTAEQQVSRDCSPWKGSVPSAAWQFEPWKSTKDAGSYEDHTGLGVTFWRGRLEDQVFVISFRGTNFNSFKDWMSNLRWFNWMLRFIPRFPDQYSEVATKVSALVLEKLIEETRDWDLDRKKRVRIFSTGHSLGGGLAQHFAYTFPDNDYGWKVEQVFAFDPSPVTGYFSVESDKRKVNSENLVIHRVFEHGEALAYLRWLIGYVNPPSGGSPLIRQYRFNYVESLNPFANHRVDGLVVKFQ